MQVDSANEFNESELLALNSISGEKFKDSTFIRTALKFKYNAEMEKLNHRSVTGKPEFSRMCKGVVTNYHGKQALTPEKVAAIKQAFNQRVTKTAINLEDFKTRASEVYFNKYLSASITNNTATKKQKIVNI